MEYSGSNLLTRPAESIPRHSLGSFLRTARLDIPAAAGSLGPYERAGARRGRRVTQEEFAEAIGVSRVWYSMLESGATLRASLALLDRIAQVLALDASARATLFSVAIPELEGVIFARS